MSDLWAEREETGARWGGWEAGVSQRGSHIGRLKSWRQEGNHLCPPHPPRPRQILFWEMSLWKQKREEAGRGRGRGTSYKAVQTAARPVRGVRNQVLRAYMRTSALRSLGTFEPAALVEAGQAERTGLSLWEPEVEDGDVLAGKCSVLPFRIQIASWHKNESAATSCYLWGNFPALRPHH